MTAAEAASYRFSGEFDLQNILVVSECLAHYLLVLLKPDPV